MSFGKDKLPPEIYRETILEIANINLGCVFLIVGFVGMMPMLLETNERCQVFLREEFAAIGDGAFLAQAVLMRREHMGGRNLSEALYYVYEAKKFAESVTTVGRVTSITVLDNTGAVKHFSSKGIEFLDEKIAEFGLQDVPDSLPIQKYLRGEE